MRVCHHCHGTGLAPAPARADIIAALRQAAEDRRMVITFDGRVSEADAAELIGVALKTLRNRRYDDAPVPSIKRGGRIWIAIEDLAAFADR